jgi:hypothetical protein
LLFIGFFISLISFIFFIVYYFNERIYVFIMSTSFLIVDKFDQFILFNYYFIVLFINSMFNSFTWLSLYIFTILIDCFMCMLLIHNHQMEIEFFFMSIVITSCWLSLVGHFGLEELGRCLFHELNRIFWKVLNSFVWNYF